MCGDAGGAGSHGGLSQGAPARPQLWAGPRSRGDRDRTRSRAAVTFRTGHEIGHGVLQPAGAPANGAKERGCSGAAAAAYVTGLCRARSLRRPGCFSGSVTGPSEVSADRHPRTLSTPGGEEAAGPLDGGPGPRMYPTPSPGFPPRGSGTNHWASPDLCSFLFRKLSSTGWPPCPRWAQE